MGPRHGRECNAKHFQYGRLCRGVRAAVPAGAALAPNYQRIAELRGVLDHQGVNAALQDATIERIEYVRPDLYRVTAGRCHVDVAIVGIPLPRGVAGPRRFEVRPGRRVCG
jgi:hypothetical protein